MLVTLRRILARAPLRILLALMLVPVVILAQTAPATAATSGVTRHHFEGFEVNNVGLGWADCQVSWGLVGDTNVAISTQSRCDGGPDATPGACQAFEAGCGSYGYVIKDSAGETCGSAGLDSVAADDNGVKAIHTRLVAKSTAVLASGCEPAEACLSYYWDAAGPGARDDVTCAPIVIDLPEPPTSSCPHGTPEGVTSEWYITEDTPTRVTTTIEARVNGVAQGQTRDGISEGWNMAVWLYDTASGIPTPLTGSAHEYGGWPIPNMIRQRGYGSSKVNGTYTPPSPRAVVGVEVYYVGPPSDATSWNTQSGTSGHDGEGAYIATRVPTGPNNSYGGITDPAHCRFWFGPKVVDFPDTVVDDPWGEVDPEPPVTEPPPTEAPDEESDNWLYLIWRTLVQIGTAIGRLAGAIASAITSALGSLVDAVVDGIGALFIPEDGFFESQWERLSDRLDRTSPAKYLDGVDRWVPSPAGGGSCAGPTVTLPIAGTTKTFTPLDACSGAMSNAAAVSRIVATVGLVLFGAIASVRALGSGFGWNPGIGGRGDS